MFSLFHVLIVSDSYIIRAVSEPVEEVPSRGSRFLSRVSYEIIRKTMSFFRGRPYHRKVSEKVPCRQIRQILDKRYQGWYPVNRGLG